MAGVVVVGVRPSGAMIGVVVGWLASRFSIWVSIVCWWHLPGCFGVGGGFAVGLPFAWLGLGLPRRVGVRLGWWLGLGLPRRVGVRLGWWVGDGYYSGGATTEYVN